MTTTLRPNVQQALDELRSNACKQPIRDPPLREIASVQFGMASKDEILGLSVCEVNSSKVAQPPNGTVYDEFMGPCHSKGICSSCNEDIRVCPGHNGHIELAVPIIHPMFHKVLLDVLNCICLKCSMLKISQKEIDLEVSLQHDRCIRYIDRLKIIVKKCGSIAYCNNCNCVHPTKINYTDDGNIYQIYESNAGKTKGRIEIKELENILLNISQEDLVTMGFQPEKRIIMKHGKIPIEEDTFRSENLLLTHLLVIPPIARPPDHTGGSRSDDDLTTSYTDIVKANEKLKVETNEVERVKLQQNLIKHIKALFDNSDGTVTRSSGKVAKGIKERVISKNGIVRNNCAGKRVDQSARTVIVSGSDLRMDQVGVPQEFADQLSYPEKVIARNYKRLTQLLNDGKINSIKRGNKTIKVKYALEAGRVIKLKPNDIVYRNLQDGDIVVLNRQPSLHRGSMMGHSVVICPGRAMRLNTADTTPYNADFDGDEMQLHVPQDIKTVVEVTAIMKTDKLIVSSQAGKPIIGIIQDTQVGVYLLSMKKESIDRKVFMNCIISAGKSHVANFANLLSRARALGVTDLYSGKMLFSVLLPKDFQFTRKNDACKEEPIVEIKNGVLLKGIIDKKAIGRSNGSIIHRLFKEYGSEVCSQFITSIQFLINRWLDYEGFSVGFSDFMISEESKQNVKKSIEKAFIEVEQIQMGNDDAEIKEIRINNSLNNCGGASKSADHVQNRMDFMIDSGAKGSQSNGRQISKYLGQNTVEGQRVQKEIDNGSRTLPCYERGDENPVTRGFIIGCFLDGLNPDEFFIHAKAGREGMINTAIKTSSAGYASRRLVKRMEDKTVDENKAITNGSGIIVSFSYGDGFDPTLEVRGDGPSFIDIDALANRLNTDDTCNEDYATVLSEFGHIGFNNHVSQITQEYEMSKKHISGLKKTPKTTNMLVNLNKALKKVPKCV